jgi:acetyl-CoA C-acetyltransferase
MAASSTAGVTNVVIVGAARTAVGSFGGALSTVSATELGACAIRGALGKLGVSADAVQASIMGNVLSAHVTGRVNRTF